MNKQTERLISADKLMKWLYSELEKKYPEGLEQYVDGRETALQIVIHRLEQGIFDPDPIPLPTLKPGDKVRHKDFPNRGEGIVYAISKKGDKAEVYFAKTEVGYGIRAYYRLDKLELVEVQEDVR